MKKPPSDDLSLRMAEGPFTTRMPASTCPNCRATLDAATGAQGPVEPGDFSVCANCRAVLRFQDDFSVRMAEPEEISDHAHDLHAVQEAILRCQLSRTHS